MTAIHSRADAGSAKDARLEARVTEEQKQLFMQAAAIQGRTLTGFLVSSAVEVATKIVREHELMTLTGRDREAFVASLLDPPAPGERLRKAAARYRKITDN